MSEYHIYCVNSENRVVSRHTYEAADDLSALELAKKHCGMYEVEAWQGTRIVARLTKDGAASTHENSRGQSE